MRIGYLVSEFPGSTHIFLWRELRALEKSGLPCDIISTRMPRAWKMPHLWSAQAVSRTTYLQPLRLKGVLGGLWAIIRSGPGGWGRSLGAILRAEGINTLKARARLVGLALMGGHLAWLARRRGWNHVHVHSCADAAHIAMFAHLFSGLRYSMTLHAQLAEFGPNQRNKWRHADFAIVITHRLLEVVRRELSGSLPPRLDVAPMGVELERFTRSEAYRPWSGTGECRIFSCGRLNRGKGHEYLIRAVGLLRGQGLDAKLRIAGAEDKVNFEYSRVLEQLIDELALRGHIELLGGVSEEIVRQELEQAHVFALASRRDELGVATMEAMAMRLPVVVSRIGGITEMIEDGVEGLLVESENPPALAAALARVLRDPALAERLGEAARQKVEQKFHSRVSAEVLMRCLGAEPQVAEGPEPAVISA